MKVLLRYITCGVAGVFYPENQRLTKRKGPGHSNFNRFYFEIQVGLGTDNTFYNGEFDPGSG